MRGDGDTTDGPISSGIPSGFVGAFEGSGVYRWSATWIWASSISGNGTLFALEADDADNVYVAGDYGPGSVDFGGGPLFADHEAFLASYATGGTHRWSRILHSDEVSEARDMALGADSVVVAGRYHGRMDLDGTTLGPTSGTGDDGFLAIYGRDGTFRRAASYGDSGNDDFRAVRFMGDGNFVVTGERSGIVDLGAGPLEPGTNFLASVSPSLSTLWSGNVGDVFVLEPQDVVITRSGRIVVSGEDDDPDDIYIAVHDSTGNHLWSRLLDGSGYLWGESNLAVGPTGDVFIAGIVEGSMDFGAGGVSMPDVSFIAHYTSDGIFDAAQRFPGVDITEIALDDTGALYVVGGFDRGVTVGGDVLSDVSGEFLAKFQVE